MRPCVHGRTRLRDIAAAGRDSARLRHAGSVTDRSGTAAASPAELAAALRSTGYLADDGIATAVYLAMAMNRPLFCEGEPGTGKTALAQALAAGHRGRADPAAVPRRHRRRPGALRLGLPAPAAAPARARGRGRRHRRHPGRPAIEASLYEPRFLLARPILRALQTSPSVLLIDEVDRADDEFEAFLLEVLTEHAVTIPELGEIRASTPPLVVLTSNRTREVHDALKRRCLYLWLDHPDLAREIEILHSRLPGLPERLAAQVAGAVRALRQADLLKPPGRRRDHRLGAGAAAGRRPAPRPGQRGGHPRRRAQVPRGRRPRAQAARHPARRS